MSNKIDGFNVDRYTRRAVAAIMNMVDALVPDQNVRRQIRMVVVDQMRLLRTQLQDAAHHDDVSAGRKGHRGA